MKRVVTPFTIGLVGLIVINLVLAYFLITKTSSADPTQPADGTTEPPPVETPLSGEAMQSVTPTSQPTYTLQPTFTPQPTYTLPPESSPTLAPTAMPEPSSTIAPVVNTIEHTIQSGQTLAFLVNCYGVTEAEILALNPQVTNPELIIAGQVIYIPRTGPADAECLMTPTPEMSVVEPIADIRPGEQVLGHSADGHPIDLYTFGYGVNELVFVGAIHGGYEWNTANLAYRAIQHLDQNPEIIPPTVTVHIVPVLNPDGLVAVGAPTGGAWISADQVAEDTTPGRTNANGVDLNRNWDCIWTADARWGEGRISGGTAPFSEPETAMLRDFLLSRRERLRGVIFWHSSWGKVVPAKCNDQPHPPSDELATVYGDASGYGVAEFVAYPITGDASDWLATQGVASVAVELTNHESMDWSRNVTALEALLDYYAADDVETGIE